MNCCVFIKDVVTVKSEVAGKRYVVVSCPSVTCPLQVQVSCTVLNIYG